MNGRRGGDELVRLIERSAELKRDLVDFTCSPRMQRSLDAAIREAGLEEDLEGSDAIGFLDRFALQYRMRDGRTAHPDTVDAVFRKILRRKDFTWAEDGEALLRRRKAWYYAREPRPGVSVIGARPMELASGNRG